MSDTKYIPSVGSSGKKDGGVYAINPAGDLVGTKLIPLKGGAFGLKAGWRPATEADIKAKVDAEKRRALAEKGG